MHWLAMLTTYGTINLLQNIKPNVNVITGATGNAATTHSGSLPFIGLTYRDSSGRVESIKARA